MQNNSNIKTVMIHNTEYVPVAERLKLAREDIVSIHTEVLLHDPVVVKATLETKNGTFTGISAANPSKVLEKQSPYEIAETSALGRALGFAGYGVLDSIASAEEMIKASEDTYVPKPQEKTTTASGIPQFKTTKSERKFTKPTDAQLKFIQNLMQQKGYTNDDLINQGLPAVDKITGEASEVIDYLKSAVTRLDVNGKPLNLMPEEEPPIESYAKDIVF